MISANLSAIFYLISGVLFILALRGLSSPETSRQGNFFGILGMVIAITVTFLSTGNFSSGFVFVLIFILIGGSIGAFIAYKIPMTAMPELVAGFHSLVGLSAGFVAISACCLGCRRSEHPVYSRLNDNSHPNNAPPAKIFMGDSRSLTIGFILAAILIPTNLNVFLGIQSDSPFLEKTMGL